MDPVTPIDYTTLTAAVDFSTVGTAVLAVGVALAGVYVAIRGIRLVIGFLRA